MNGRGRNTAKTRQNRPEGWKWAFLGQNRACSRGGDSPERRNLEREDEKCGFLPKAATADNSPAIYGWDL
jgi:hypothetical protein